MRGREVVTLRRDADPIVGEPVVQFRLYYEGPLFAAKGDAFDGQTDRRRAHKQAIRSAFHKQLQHFWNVHPALSELNMPWGIFRMADQTTGGENSRKYTLAEGLASLNKINGVSFVPLVCERFSLLCDLHVLLLRRDKPGGILQARDLDNRLKTLFDALRMPKNGLEMADVTIAADEDPMFVLLEDDSLISSVSVETDELLDPPEESGKDDSYVRIVLNVKLHPYHVNMFNLSFA